MLAGQSLYKSREINLEWKYLDCISGNNKTIRDALRKGCPNGSEQLTE